MYLNKRIKTSVDLPEVISDNEFLIEGEPCGVDARVADCMVVSFGYPGSRGRQSLSLRVGDRVLVLNPQATMQLLWLCLQSREVSSSMAAAR